MRHSWLTPTLGFLSAIVVLGVIAGLGEWSAPAIYAGMFATGVIWAALVIWADPAGTRDG